MESNHGSTYESASHQQKQCMCASAVMMHGEKRGKKKENLIMMLAQLALKNIHQLCCIDFGIKKPEQNMFGIYQSLSLTYHLELTQTENFYH